MIYSKEPNHYGADWYQTYTRVLNDLISNDV